MYARVALPTALPDALSYRVPDGLQSLAVPGVRVRVRLRGQARVGIVVELTADAGVPPEKVLPLEEVLDLEPLVPAHVLELVRFAADYYAAPIGTVVRSAVPAALLRVPPPLVVLGPRAREIVHGATPAERRLLERLLDARRITLARLCAEGWSARELRELLPGLQERHALRVVERSAGKAPGSTVAAD